MPLPTLSVPEPGASTEPLQPAAAPPALQAQGLGHHFPGSAQWALRGVDLAVGEGEFLCLLGPSGCGKTTLLNILAGFVRPAEGSARMAGGPILGPGTDRGVVFQEYSLFSWLTARQNVEFGLRMAGLPKDKRSEISRRYLGLVGLDKAGDKYPFQLSGGMKQRTAIARALALHPKILLMDEPFAALDAMTRADLQRQLLKAQKIEEKTVVFVTHNISEAIYLADRIIVLSPGPGRIAAQVPVDLPRPRGRAERRFGLLFDEIEALLGGIDSE